MTVQPSDFVHLHLHSEYSLLDGANRLDRLCSHVRDVGQVGVAVTDHGNLFGAIEFYKQGHKHGIKPIMGFEAYVASGARHEKKQLRGTPFEPYFHLTLLAKNEIGFRNICKLSSIGYREGFYYKPRVDREVLERHSEGLIVLSGCLSSELQRRLVRGDMEGAEESVAWHSEVFGEGNYYLEYQDHGIEEQHKANLGLFELQKKFNLPLVITNDAHYLHQDDHRAHDALLCVQTGKALDDEKRFRFDSDQFYVKTTAEMERDFGELRGALLATREIAEKVNVEIEFGKLLLPKFDIPTEYEGPDEFLAHLSREGLRERYRGDVSQDAWERLDRELGIIRDMGFAGYFLIVQDFVKASRRIGCSVGPGRGSAAGSLVAYALTITNIDPLEYDLLFERFLNPERVSMPDIDIDFADDRREMVIDYVKEKYGKDCVSQIITFSRMKAKAAIRDVGRVLSLPFSDVDRVAKLIPNELNIKLGDAIERVPELSEMAAGRDIHHDLLDMSKRIEGLCRHAGIHAAGVVITPEPVDNFVPLFQTPDGDLATQWDMKYLEECGLLKMDFLGLRTLSLIDRALELIEKGHGCKVDLETIPLEDPDTYALFGRGETIGIFQFESSGMREYLQKLKPERLGDLIAMNALYRPGPMSFIDDFIDRKQGRQRIELLHPSMEPILRDTYGIIVYQEQVMLIAQELAGYSLGGADILRRAMGKKKAEVMAEQKGIFLAGCADNNVAKKVATDVFELLEKFAQYGFNKCLSGDTLVVDGRSGQRVRVDSLVGRERAGDLAVASADPSSGRARVETVSAVMENGVRDVWRLRTASGREVVATDNHPLLTPMGWCPLGDLQPGSQVAVPRRMRWSPAFASGGLEADRILAAVEEDEELPEEACELDELDLRRVLAVVWARRSRVVASAGAREASVDAMALRAGNEREAERLLHLLARLGVVVRRHHREVWLDSPARLLAFALVMAPVDASLSSLAGRLVESVLARSQRQRGGADLSALMPEGRGDLAAWVESDLAWDTVLSIEAAGRAMTYDLEVPGTRCFVAGDLLVHNSHSAAYAYLAYQTAFLKAHYPAEFMAAAMTSVMSDSDQMAIFLDECRRSSNEVLPPCVFASEYGFTVQKGAIRFGLGAIKNVGRGAIDSILVRRDQSGARDGVFEWAKGLDLRLVNKRVVESLAAAGALRKLPGNRASIASSADRIVDVAQKHQKELASGQTSLFGGGDEIDTSVRVDLDPLEEWEDAELLKREKEVVGHYLSGHPLEGFRPEMDRFASATIAEFIEQRSAPEVIVAGLITSKRNLVTRRGDPMCVATVEDFTGVTEAVFFPEAYTENRELLESTDALLLIARRSNREGDSGLVVERAVPLADAFSSMAERVVVRISDADEAPNLRRFRELLVANGGTCPVVINVETCEAGVVSLPILDVKVRPSSKLDQALQELPGVVSVQWTRAQVSRPSENNGGAPAWKRR